MPHAGTLWVYYEYEDPAEEILVWHEGGTITPIHEGENTIPVGHGDMIIYLLQNPLENSIKLAYHIS